MLASARVCEKRTRERRATGKKKKKKKRKNWKKEKKDNPFGAGPGRRGLLKLPCAHAYNATAPQKAASGKTFNQSFGIAVVTGLVWADSPPGACYSGHSSRGFIRSDRKHRRGAARHGVASSYADFMVGSE